MNNLLFFLLSHHSIESRYATAMVRYEVATNTLDRKVAKTPASRVRVARLAIHSRRCIRIPILAIIWAAMRRHVPAHLRMVSFILFSNYYYYSISFIMVQWRIRSISDKKILFHSARREKKYMKRNIIIIRNIYMNEWFPILTVY